MKIVNKRAYYEYNVLEHLEAGMQLLGSEVKSVKGGHLDLSGAYVRVIGSEMYLVNANIPVYPYARPEGYDSRRTRKLLLHNKEIIALKTKSAQSGLTLIPLSCYTKGGKIKLEIALGQGKKKFDKRETLKKRDQEREIRRVLRNKQ